MEREDNDNDRVMSSEERQANTNPRGYIKSIMHEASADRKSPAWQGAKQPGAIHNGSDGFGLIPLDQYYPDNQSEDKTKALLHRGYPEIISRLEECLTLFFASMTSMSCPAEISIS